MSASPRAAVDVGTNSVRLLVVDAGGDRITREMTITRLGRGVDATGHLDDASLALTLDTIRGYHSIWAKHGVLAKDVRIAATSAVRDATDRDRFFDGVREITGVNAEVLSGDEEARTSFAGAASAVSTVPPVLVLDIGGGSTELIVGSLEGEVAGAVSLQLGCVRLTERLLPNDVPTPAELASASAYVSQLLEHADEVLAQQSAAVLDTRTLVGVAGTVTTLAALHLGLDTYQEDAIHGTVVPHSAVAGLLDVLATRTSAERRELGPMAPGREDVIVGGVLVLLGVMNRYGFGSVTASESDILDGLARL